MTEGIRLHLVEMHKKYGKDGLVVMAVAMDDNSSTDPTPEERAKWRKKVENYVAKEKLPFRSYHLDGDPLKPPAALNFADGVPRVYVFNRDNQFVLREQGPDKKELDKAIAEAVKKK